MDPEQAISALQTPSSQPLTFEEPGIEGLPGAVPSLSSMTCIGRPKSHAGLHGHIIPLWQLRLTHCSKLLRFRPAATVLNTVTSSQHDRSMQQLPSDRLPLQPAQRSSHAPGCIHTAAYSHVHSLYPPRSAMQTEKISTDKVSKPCSQQIFIHTKIVLVRRS